MKIQMFHSTWYHTQEGRNLNTSYMEFVGSMILCCSTNLHVVQYKSVWDATYWVAYLLNNMNFTVETPQWNTNRYVYSLTRISQRSDLLYRLVALFSNYRLFGSILNIISIVTISCVTTNGMWIGEWIYWKVIHTWIYKWIQRYRWSPNFTHHHSIP
jgi:hypothetical protein